MSNAIARPDAVTLLTGQVHGDLIAAAGDFAAIASTSAAGKRSGSMPFWKQLP